MAVSRNRPLQQLFDEVFSEDERRKKYPELSTYIEEGGSVFPLVEKGVQGLVRDFKLSREDAHAYLRRANALAIHVRRQFIEQTLTGDETQSLQALSGLLSLVPGPSFYRLFYPPFDRLCPPDALESVTSPVAYLIELLMWIRDRIESVSDDDTEPFPKMPLNGRRTDLANLSIDFKAVHQAVSSVDIIVPVLETFIQANSKEPVDVDEAMSTTRYPNGLPYYRDWTTIDFVARHHDLSVGEVARVVDLSFPYFLQPDGQSADAGRALLHASRLGPYQRMLLTEDPFLSEDPDELEEFYLLNFGASGIEGQNINQVRFFCERTKLEALELEALLSIESFAPVRSANTALKNAVPLDGAQSGSVYLNAGKSPSVGIDFRGEDREILHRLKDWSHSRIDRMNRKLRLDQWLGLPPEQVDALLMAAINTETRTQTPEHSCWISPDTLRAIGLFQGLRERCGCTVEDFAVFIDQLSIFGRGETLSQFDRVFNPPSFSAEPLKLDGSPFPVFPAPGAEEMTVSRLCHGLGINLHTYRHLAEAIAVAQKKEQTLHCDLATVSSFYRLVKLPLLLGITPVEAIILLMTLGGERWLNALAGTPRLQSNEQQDTTPDVLNVIHAMDACVRWCNEHRWDEPPVPWMLLVVAPITVPAAASSAERQLFEQLRNLLTAALFSNTALLMAGVPPLAGGADWLDLLTALVDHDGLVMVKSQAIELDYLAYARERLDLAVRAGIGEGDAASRAQIVEKMLDVLLQARAGQVSVVRECLAVHAQLRSELVVWVLAWAQGTVYQVLRQAIERTTEGDEVAAYRRREEDEGDPFLVLLADVRRRSAVVMKLDLSAALLEDYLTYGYRVWLKREDKHEFTLSTLYYLTVLTRAFKLGDQPPAALLDYLREVNALPDDLGTDALSLAQETAAIRLAIFFTWSIQEVRECAKWVDPQQELIKNLVQLDLLIRVRELAASSGMDAQTILLMGTLPAAVDKGAYSLAAEHALLSLSTSPVPFVPHDGEALEHTVMTTCVVDRTKLVANKPDEQATYTVTVKDLSGKGLKGVNVYWQAELGNINKSATDVNGVATAVFTPGKVMGTAAPRYWLDLYPKQQAPSVEIDLDETTLFFPAPLMSQVPDGVVLVGQEVELSAVILDRYGNRGIGMSVQWGGKPQGDVDFPVPQVQMVIRPSEALTNQDGLTRVFVSSPSGGTFEVGVTSLDSKITALFESITFAGGALPR
ncbi:virulence plasmid 28 protein [Pseudomonas brassicacearum]|uniref:Virulence plasmid 28 protein n=1 Tax=Pseudomonas brassicacearum TaxID=930166 RepID=A0A423H8N3_9PSED|nr:Tc toxin subunit A [Pseudomonas brassicacearum]RON09550.1 virulence plasmid 28 protein [Pseudomonas brassicacearum]